MPHPILCEFTDEGVIRVTGADAIAFLQGQLSTDIEKLTPENWQFSSWSNAKGRVTTLLRVFREDDAINLALPKALLPQVMKRLGMYILRSQVQLQDFSTMICPLGFAADDAPAFLRKSGIEAPLVAGSMTRTDDVVALRLHGEMPRYILYGEGDVISGLKRKLIHHGIEPTVDESWALGKILAGEPTVYSETSEHFVAQMLGLEELGAIDFKKGCYIGQEVIARAHYRGGVKRHMVRARCETPSMLKPGMEIQAKGQESPVAEIVDARLDGRGVWQMLMVIQDDTRGDQLVHAASGAAVTLV